MFIIACVANTHTHIIYVFFRETECTVQRAKHKKLLELQVMKKLKPMVFYCSYFFGILYSKISQEKILDNQNQC